jgi:hypothetical protein
LQKDLSSFLQVLIDIDNELFRVNVLH